MKQLYILHGWAYQTDKWQPFVDALKKRGIEGKILDIPGLTAPLSEPWTVQDYVTWLDTHLPKSGKHILLGHSNGGRIAMWYALSHADRVSRLILMDSAGMTDRNLLHVMKRSIFRVFAKTGKRFTTSPRLRRLLYKAARVRDYDTAPPVMKKTMINLIGADKTLDIESLSLPVIIIWGKNDTVTPLPDGHELKRRMPDASLHIIGDARHAPQFTHPDRVADIIHDSL